MTPTSYPCLECSCDAACYQNAPTLAPCTRTNDFAANKLLGHTLELNSDASSWHVFSATAGYVAKAAGGIQYCMGLGELGASGQGNWLTDSGAIIILRNA